MTSTFKARLAQGETLFLINPDHPSGSLVEYVGALGVDAVMIDTEQGSPDVESVEEMARAARVIGMCPLVRVFSPESHVIERYMSRGVEGIVVPRINSAIEVLKVMDDVRYCFPTDYEHKVVIIQIESSAALADLDRMLSVPGVDCFFIGVVDLSKSLGYRGDYRAPEVQLIVEETIGRIRAAGRRCGIMTKEDDLLHWRRQGVEMLYLHVNDFLRTGAAVFNRLRTHLSNDETDLGE